MEKWTPGAKEEIFRDEFQKPAHQSLGETCRNGLKKKKDLSVSEHSTDSDCKDEIEDD